MARKTKK